MQLSKLTQNFGQKEIVKNVCDFVDSWIKCNLNFVCKNLLLITYININIFNVRVQHRSYVHRHRRHQQ